MKSSYQRGIASVSGRMCQFPPGDEPDVLFPEQLAKLRAGEEIKIALTPCGAPSITLAGGSFHFLVGVCKVDDELSDTGLKIFEGSLVEFVPFFRRDIRIDGNCVIEDDVSRTQSRFEVGSFGKPIPRNESRQFVITGDAEKRLKELRAVIDEPVLMRIKMRGTNSHRISAVNLHPQLQLSFLRIDPRSRSPIVIE